MIYVERATTMTIQKLRKDRGWSREYVAVQVGVTFSTIANLEAGRHLPRIDLAQKLASLFGVSLDDIEWGKPESEKEDKGVDPETPTGD